MTDATLRPPARRGFSKLAGATAGMAVGTALSRVTGVLRLIVLAYVLGYNWFADGYNIANTTPNIIVDIVLTGVLSATFVPVFVDRLSTRNTDDAWRAISAVTTVTIVVLLGATVAFWFAAPAIIHLYTSANHSATVELQQAAAVTLLRWFVPQLACYGLIALFTALLNTQRKFAAPMFVPIANNVVVIVVLLWFHAAVGHLNSSPPASLAHQQGNLALLGLGTTLGVVAQAALLFPSLRRARLHLHLVWEPRHEAMRRIVRLAGWTFGLVIANQLALVVILALADGVKPAGAVSAYTYAYAFFQLPYGIVAVSVMSAVTPSLSARWALGDLAAFRHRMAFGMRGMLTLILPAAMGMLILSHVLAELFLAPGGKGATTAETIGTTLAMFSLGLPGFCVFLYMTRVLQSMQDTRTAFYLYVVENVVNVVAGVALVHVLGVRGLALSLSLAYTVAAALAWVVLHNRLGGLDHDLLGRPVKRILGATLVMGVLTELAVNVSSASSGFGLLFRVVFATFVGAVTYVGTIVVLAARASRHDPPTHRPPGRRPEPSFHGRLDPEPGPRTWQLRPVRDDPDWHEEGMDDPDPGGDR